MALGAFENDAPCVGALPAALAKDASISSCVRFLLRRNDILLSSEEDDTLGS